MSVRLTETSGWETGAAARVMAGRELSWTLYNLTAVSGRPNRLPPAIVPLLSPFASLFDARIWRKAQILSTGVILAPGRRTVSTALYALGLQGRGDVALFHHVLSRASWSGSWCRRGRCDWPSMRPWNGAGG
ncbi:MAG: hypothetical protein J4G06_09080, partial [Caldilineaceae bacterium]|nr:hypothetical protein [Caldilineaceae bacterium]